MMSDLSPTRLAIIDILRHAPAGGIQTSEISSRLGRAQSTISTILAKLEKAGYCFSPTYGRWKDTRGVESIQPIDKDKLRAEIIKLLDKPEINTPGSAGAWSHAPQILGSGTIAQLQSLEEAIKAYIARVSGS
jgi:DNA-binding transcriptional ArsR family regulator